MISKWETSPMWVEYTKMWQPVLYSNSQTNCMRRSYSQDTPSKEQVSLCLRVKGMSAKERATWAWVWVIQIKTCLIDNKIEVPLRAGVFLKGEALTTNNKSMNSRAIITLEMQQSVMKRTLINRRSWSIQWTEQDKKIINFKEQAV